MYGVILLSVKTKKMPIFLKKIEFRKNKKTTLGIDVINMPTKFELNWSHRTPYKSGELKPIIAQ